MLLGDVSCGIVYFVSRGNSTGKLLAHDLPARSLSGLQVNDTFVCGQFTDQNFSLRFTTDTVEGFINMTYQIHARHQSSTTTMLFIEKELDLMHAWKPQYDLALMNASDWAIRNEVAPNVLILPLSNFSAELSGLEKCNEGDDAWECKAYSTNMDLVHEFYRTAFGTSIVLLSTQLTTKGIDAVDSAAVRQVHALARHVLPFQQTLPFTTAEFNTVTEKVQQQRRANQSRNLQSCYVGYDVYCCAQPSWSFCYPQPCRPNQWCNYFCSQCCQYCQLPVDPGPCRRRRSSGLAAFRRRYNNECGGVEDNPPGCTRRRRAGFCGDRRRRFR